MNDAMLHFWQRTNELEVRLGTLKVLALVLADVAERGDNEQELKDAIMAVRLACERLT